MQMTKPLKDRLKEVMELRRVKVPALSEQTGIPKDRIYAWYRDNTSPKAEDQIRLEKWLNGETSTKENVFSGTSANQSVEEKSVPGFVPADQVIADLRRDKEWLQSILGTSLASIVEGQQQTGIQLKALSWFSALAAAGGDEKKAQDSILAINNRMAFYEGVGDEGDSQKTADSTHTGGSRQRKQH